MFATSPVKANNSSYYNEHIDLEDESILVINGNKTQAEQDALWEEWINNPEIEYSRSR